MKLNHFKDIPFLPAIKALFNELKVPMNYVADEPTTAEEILKDTYKDNETFQLVDDVYFVGMIDNAAFKENPSLDARQIKSDYDGILVFGITLNQRDKNLLPTRSQLAEISRAFNREFYYTPVVLVFKYQDEKASYIAFANTERLKYKQAWREGEKAGKVSLLRDINIERTHRGHEDIINQLRIPTSGTKAVDSFAKLYIYWQEVFNVSVLNKKFYQELQNWYFWARGEVVFPSAPLRIDYNSEREFEDALDEHNGKNLIRLLTRILFVWFVKEKGLIPPQIFDEKFISEELLDEFQPQKPHGFFAEGKHTSRFYRAVLQNLFFATLNCEKDKREFRKDGIHQNTTHLMRYKSYFKNPEVFLSLMETHVPFMNGGLFDCLDKPHKEKKGRQGGDIIIYQDGFSDKDDNPLNVPDYLFFDKDEPVDLSKAYGQAKYKNVHTKGLLKILESYKFTITENTPIEEDVALDPELLGRVFENLLASYNPETKTTARKQTGSFYTPREIVNYMVDESLIAYLKNSVNPKLWDSSNDSNDERLHKLLAFDNQAKFEADTELKNALIKSIDNCKILDPACGSGAFPMGVLQKMVHILHKVDPDNNEWKQRQLNKIDEAISRLDEIEDSEIRDKSVKELKEQKKDIEQAFERNDLDYGRKLYLIENCIYGLDIQSIAVQITKLRFFISLIVDQHVDNEKKNFGIRPLPNLETKFVAANTLIGVNKGQSLFDNQEVKELEKQIKLLNKKLFSIKTPSRKRELREEIKAVRNEMATILEDEGLDNQSARQLADWDPFDQNASSPFFDPEWMFDISEGFDVVIGNPPYLKERDNASFFEPVNRSEFGKKWHQGKMDFWFYFLHKAIDLSKSEICFITSRYWLNSQGAKKLINRVKKELAFANVIDIGKIKVFDAVAGHHMVSHYSKRKKEKFKYVKVENDLSIIERLMDSSVNIIKELRNSDVFKSNDEILFEKDAFSDLSNTEPLSELFDTSIGIQESVDKISSKQLENSGLSNFHVGQGVFVLSEDELEELNLNNEEIEHIKPYVDPNDICKYSIEIQTKKFIIYSDKELKTRIENDNKLSNIKKHLDLFSPFITSSNKPYGLHRPRKQKYFEFPKIIFKGMFVYPEFEYDDDKYYFGFSFSSIIQKNKNFSLKYLLALLNSRFAQKWFNTHGKQRGAGVDIGVEKLRLFPVLKANRDIQSLVSNLVDCARYYRSSNAKASKAIEATIDGLVFNLYFSDHMKEREIDVIEYVDRDYNKALQGREFVSLSDTEKEKVIVQLQDTWSHPDNEVRNRMKLFAVRSPEILKPILES
jgi:hypothetical protein